MLPKPCSTIRDPSNAAILIGTSCMLADRRDAVTMISSKGKKYFDKTKKELESNDVTDAVDFINLNA